MAQRRRSRAQWRRLVDGWPRSGLRQQGYCDRHGISVGSLRRWQQIFREEREAALLVPDVVIKDTETKALVNNITFSDAQMLPRGVTGLVDINGNDAPEIAVLMKSRDGLNIAEVRDGKTGDWLNSLQFLGKQYQGIAITSQDLNNDGFPELSVLGVNANGSPEVAVLLEKADGTNTVIIRDGKTDKWLHSMQFLGKQYEGRALTSQDLDHDWVSELSVLGVKQDGNAAAQIKDSASKQSLNWIPFPAN